jgi:nitric oxide reductase NorD protein
MLAERARPTELPPAVAAAVEAAAAQAARSLSPRGLEAYHAALASLSRLGRGDGVPLALVGAAPALARELGEQALEDLVGEALRLASKVSGKVIERLIETAPLAAARLGDAELFRAYLALVAHVAAQAPRGLRPMLEQTGALLGQLTLGGLRRWAQWGIQTYRTQYDEQVRYFSLDNAQSRAVLQQERRGTLWVDVQRRIGMYLRALFGRDFAIRPSAGDFETRAGYRPAIVDGVIHLPDAYDEPPESGGLDLYRAAAVHAAAHLAYTGERLLTDGMSPLQVACVSLIEDARIEALAIRAFPNLRRLWARLHTATPRQRAGIGDYLDRAARALIDPCYADDDLTVAEIRMRFEAAAARGLGSNKMSLDLGLALAARLMFEPLSTTERGGEGLGRGGASIRNHAPSPPTPLPQAGEGSAPHVSWNPGEWQPSALYRDDNRYTLEFTGGLGSITAVERALFSGRVRKHVSLMEFINETDTETAGDDAQEIWVLQSALYPYEDGGVPYGAENETQAAPLSYPEWDYQSQLQRPAWTQVRETRPEASDPARADAILAQHKPLLSRLRRVIEALQPQGVQRLRKQEDGDEIDLNAALDALTDLRLGRVPDPRCMLRHRRSQRDIAVLILLDLSESGNERLPDGRPVIELALEAALLTAETLHRIGDPFAIHGFQSDGRHAVHYRRFKDFDRPYDAQARGRLCGMRAALSTRMGAAVRHGAHLLGRLPQRRKLLLVLTDGAPADIDERDPQYLRFDARKAVEEARAAGVTSFCLSLDPQADQYVERIFGKRHAMVLDNIGRLPEKLPMLYAGLTK